MKANIAQKAHNHNKKCHKKPTDVFVWRGSKEQKQLWGNIADGALEKDVPPMDARLSRVMHGALPLSATEW